MNETIEVVVAQRGHEQEKAFSHNLLGEISDERVATARCNPHQMTALTGAGVSQQLQLGLREHRQALRDLASQSESGRSGSRLK